MTINYSSNPLRHSKGLCIKLTMVIICAIQMFRWVDDSRALEHNDKRENTAYWKLKEISIVLVTSYFIRKNNATKVGVTARYHSKLHCAELISRRIWVQESIYEQIFTFVQRYIRVEILLVDIGYLTNDLSSYLQREYSDWSSRFEERKNKELIEWKYIDA